MDLATVRQVTVFRSWMSLRIGKSGEPTSEWDWGFSRPIFRRIWPLHVWMFRWKVISAGWNSSKVYRCFSIVFAVLIKYCWSYRTVAILNQWRWRDAVGLRLWRNRSSLSKIRKWTSASIDCPLFNLNRSSSTLKPTESIRRKQPISWRSMPTWNRISCLQLYVRLTLAQVHEMRFVFIFQLETFWLDEVYRSSVINIYARSLGGFPLAYIYGKQTTEKIKQQLETTHGQLNLEQIRKMVRHRSINSLTWPWNVF